MQTEDFKWFVDHYADLFAKYGPSFLAIKNHTVIGVYPSFADGVYGTLKTEDPGTFIIQECNGSETAYISYISSTNFM